MFRRNTIRIINQSHKLLNNATHNLYLSEYFASSMARLSKQMDCVDFLMKSFDCQSDNKIKTMLRDLPAEQQGYFYKKYFEALVLKCDNQGKIHSLYDYGKLIGCVLSIPFHLQTFSCPSWEPFIKQVKANGLQHVAQEMIDIESHFKQHIVDIADANCYEQQFDTHIMEFIAIHPSYQNKGFAKSLINLVSEDYKRNDSALILNTCNERIANLFENTLELKVEESSQFKEKEIKWFSVPPILHNYWNY